MADTETINADSVPALPPTIGTLARASGNGRVVVDAPESRAALIAEACEMAACHHLDGDPRLAAIYVGMAVELTAALTRAQAARDRRAASGR